MIFAKWKQSVDKGKKEGEHLDYTKAIYLLIKEARPDLCAIPSWEALEEMLNKGEWEFELKLEIKRPKRYQ